ncbi:transcriptional regulator [Actinocatenispora thailandica]|uniref:Transcriptional regulator n=1 Tax=Actinocatenispora thailandica TaxID=227318 RepID=A0A7R7HYZ1_9ACTN|nr:ROK family transcriptional regulator [Actinocatenispora thailandica]BCJ36799.1 transcriptional regulator [Actinocatenispora thailandica]
MPPATPRTARLINDRSAYQLLLDRGPLTRTQLRALTGLSRPTVADLIDRLAADGLIARLGESGAERRGPNAALYGVLADRAHVAGVAVDTSRIVVTRADATGRTVGTARLPIDPDADPASQVLAALTAAGGGAPAGAPDPAPSSAADPAAHRAPLGAVAVGTPGLVDPASGAVTFAAGLPGWHGDLRTALRDRLGVPVLVDNEVNLAGVAEHRIGAARDTDTYCLLSLGAGVGVAVLLGGRMHRGASGGAGEIGYLPYLAGPGVPGHGSSRPAGGPGRPARGMQQLIGAPALAALAARHLPGAPPPDPVDAVLAAVPEPEFRVELAQLVAVAVVGLCAVLDPGTIVLGGPIGHAGGAPLAELVAAEVAAAIPLPTEVRAGTVTGDPALRGAVLTGLDLLHDDLFGS